MIMHAQQTSGMCIDGVLYIIYDINCSGSYTKKSVRGKTCEGCSKPDCEKCDICLDKKKFGGLGKKKQACIYMRCIHLQNSGMAI